MKEYLLIVLLIISFKLSSQTYKPFPIDSAVWGLYVTGPSGNSIQKEIVKGDTLLGGKNYHKVYSNTNSLLGFYRENAKKIYGKVKYYADTSEIILYDYNLNVGDTFYDKRTPPTGSSFIFKYVVSSISTTTLTTDTRKQYNFNYAGYSGAATSYSNLGNSCLFYWIEGIGSGKGVFNNRSVICEGTECYQAALISNASFAYLKCFEHKNIQYMVQSCLTVGMNEQLSSKSNLFFYPNPVRDILNFHTENRSLQNIYIQIKTMLGQTLMETKLEDSIDISSLKNGIYFLLIFDNNNFIATEKFVKE